jgi:hypothetical protein
LLVIEQPILVTHSRDNRYLGMREGVISDFISIFNQFEQRLFLDFFTRRMRRQGRKWQWYHALLGSRASG